jgi:uncharacterized membrane protein YtjA (UPF0391 family)
MIRWTITFLVIALIAALFGFGWIASAAAEKGAKELAIKENLVYTINPEY